MSTKLPSTEDILVQQGRPARTEGRHVNLPIELGSTMVFDTIGAFEEASGVSLTSSGVAAISMALSAIVKPGDHLLVADHVYGNTRNFCDAVLSVSGVEIEYYDPMIGADIRQLFRQNTKAIMFEAPGSGTFEYPDIRAITDAASNAGVTTILDGTWSAACISKPLNLSVDILLYSISKYICGHSDAMLGAIAYKDADLGATVRKCVFAYGDKPGSQEVYLALRGLRTLAMRMSHVDRAGRELAVWLQKQKQVKRILHPAFDTCPGHVFWHKYNTGAAGLFGVVFHTQSQQQIRAFVDELHHFGIGVSWVDMKAWYYR